MTSNPEDPRAEAFMRRAVLNAEMRGEDITSALRAARRAVESGEHLKTASLVDEAVYDSVRRIVAFISHCYDQEIVFEHEGQMLSAEDVWGDIAFVFGGGGDDEDTCRAIIEIIAKVAGT